MKKAILVLLFGLAANLACGQERAGKEYYIGRHATSLQYAAHIFGIQPNYHYIFNPRARFMWMGKAGIGYSPFEPWPYYNVGIDLAYGGKNRVFVGVGAAYNVAATDSKFLSGDIGYLLLGKKHLFFSITLRVYYEPYCDCPRFSPFWPDLLFSLGWAF